MLPPLTIGVAQEQPLMRVVDAVTGLATTNVGNPHEPFPADGVPFTANMTLTVTSPIDNLMAFQIGIKYDMTLMNCTAASLRRTDPSFVFYGKSPVTVTPQIVVEGNLSYVYWGASLLFADTLPAGEYLLGQANFSAYRAGTTDDSGMFSVHWTPPLNQTLALRAEFIGDSTHLSAEASANLCTALTQSQHVFTVESNGTIAELLFNETDRTLTFLTSGKDGTAGYAKVTIPKSLQPIKVYINGSEQQYSHTSTEKAWEIVITYVQSSHQINSPRTGDSQLSRTGLASSTRHRPRDRSNRRNCITFHLKEEVEQSRSQNENLPMISER
jgi:hypothetical protein